jgi:hypothetical protein
MTEAEWRKSADPGMMLESLKGHASDRKLRLLACACCRAVWVTFHQGRSKQAVEAAERYADGLLDNNALRRTYSMAHDALARYQQLLARWGVVNGDTTAMVEWRLRLAAQSAHIHRPFLIGRLTGLNRDPDLSPLAPRLLRDIFGPRPADQITADPAWLTSTAVALAGQMYESRDFGAMPILADALQDAGCDNADILDHCRGPGPHVRGCWVVDLLLGKL